jgi:hypothetical protein
MLRALRITSRLSSDRPIASRVLGTVHRGLKGLVVGVPKEYAEGEHRVALVPVNVQKLASKGITVKVSAATAIAATRRVDHVLRKERLQELMKCV